MTMWRVHEHGIYWGTLRIAVFDFDTNPSKEFREKIYRTISDALNRKMYEDCECDKCHEQMNSNHEYFESLKTKPLICAVAVDNYKEKNFIATLTGKQFDLLDSCEFTKDTKLLRFTVPQDRLDEFHEALKKLQSTVFRRN